jgi:transcriptional regulator with XRE-family HTH domain
MRQSRRHRDPTIDLSSATKGEKMTIIEDSTAARLVQAVRAAGLNRTELARSVGAVPAEVSRWLKGTGTPTECQFNAMAIALGVSPDWLAHGTVPMRAADPPPDGAGIAARPIWDFRPAPRDGGRDFGNPNVWAFDPCPEVLVREVIQNSLDAAAEAGGRVEVAFRLIRLAAADKRDFLRALEFDDLREHLEAAAAGGQKLGALLHDGLARVDDQDLLLLVVDDRGTVGLTGPERGRGHFTALCRNNLDSNKDGAAGGAFGLGKAVLWRASRLATVLFGSHLSRPAEGRSDRRLFGRCELPWHEHRKSEYAGPGWFGRPAAAGAESIREDDERAAALYLDREAAGTSLCVVGFHDAASDRDRSPDDLARDLARAAARDFFPAMVAGRLAVRVEVYDGRREYDGRRPSWARDVEPDESVPAYARMLRAYRAGETVEQLGDDGAVASRPVALAVPERTADAGHGEQVHRAVLLVAAAGEEADDDGEGRSERANHLVAFRGPGMVVLRQSLQGACLGARPVHGLLLCGLAPRLIAGGAAPAPPADVAAERFLQAAEPPAHDRWTATPTLRASYARGCVSRLERFLAAATDGVRQLVKAPMEDAGDGPRSLKDLFRLGDERAPNDGPRVIEQSGSVDAAGRWAVGARVRLNPASTPTRLTPAVYFLGESGDGVAVAWAALEPGTPGCVAEDGGLLLPAGTREVRFTGLTDPRSHPIHALASCVRVEIKRFTPVREALS